MLLPALTSKNMPRLWSHEGEEPSALQGVNLVWPDLSRSPVYDLNVAGLSTKYVSEFGKIKLGSSKQIRIEIPGIADFINLDLKISKQTASIVTLNFDGVTPDGRLVLQQVLKDKLVVDNLRLEKTETLLPQLRADLWIHGPYDTNVMLWREGEEITQAILEYDNLQWIYEEGEISLQRSLSSGGESRGYFGSKVGAPVAMGASWPDRLLKLLQSVEKKFPESSGIEKLFERQRS